MTDELFDITRELLSKTTDELLRIYFSMDSRDEDLGLLPEELEEMAKVKAIIYHRTGTDPISYARKLKKERRQPWHRH